MRTKEEFIAEALSGNGVENDIATVWVTVGGKQYVIPVEEVLGREEKEPFEASYALEEDVNAKAWDTLYDEYLESRELTLTAGADEDTFEEEKSMSYFYGMKHRGFAPACQPMNGLVRRIDDLTGRYFDILKYDRELSETELRIYELEKVVPEAEEVAARIRESGMWLITECEKLCQLANLTDEWNDADADGFEAVVYKAAEILGVDLEE